MLQPCIVGGFIEIEPPPGGSLRQRISQLDGYMEGRRAMIPLHRLLDFEDVFHMAGIHKSEEYNEARTHVFWGVSQGEQEERATLLYQNGTTTNIPGLTVPLYPYQQRAVSMLHRAGSGILADEPGLGKTLQGLAWALLTPGPTLVCCPAGVAHVWEDEIATKTTATSFVARGRRPIEFPDTRFIIVPYSILDNHADTLDAKGFTSVIFDEAHHLRNSRTQKSSAGAFLVRGINHILMMSGTLVVRDASDLYPIVHAIRPNHFPDEKAYRNRYCKIQKVYIRGGRQATRVVGSQRLRELRVRLHPWLAARTLAEVREELPERRVSVITVDPSPPQLLAYQKSVGAMREAGRRGDSPLPAFRDVEQVCRDVRVTAAREILEDFLHLQDRKLLVFSHHLDALDQLQSKQWEDQSTCITGSVPAAQRGARIREFQNNPRIRAAFCQLEAGGEGITLDAADTVLFVDSGWTPARVKQAERRALRVTSKTGLQVIHLKAALPVDEERWRRLSERLDALDRAHGWDREEAHEDLRQDVVDFLLASGLP